MTPPSYFRSNGYTTDSVIDTESGKHCDLSTLPAFLRTLLVMDGTVTKALEAWFWEPVKVVTQHNSLEKLKSPIVGLQAQQGDQVLMREVLLQGEHSLQVFACARSSVSLEYLPADMGNALKQGKIGIGELFRQRGLETYREIININYLLQAPEDDALLAPLKSNLVSRSYQIWVNSHPAIIVTEFFPVEIF